MFGLPVVLNLSLIIPFIIAPMFNAITTYTAMKLGWVPLCNGTVIPWTMPPLISGFWQLIVLPAQSCSCLISLLIF